MPPRPSHPRGPSAAVELVIDELAAGGDGVGRLDGKVVFVGGVAPGERVRIRLTDEHAGFSRGELVEILAPSRVRVAPRCKHAADRSCGGCPWQHVARSAQLEAKQAQVTSALRKAIAAGLRLHPIHAVTPDAGWRRRARLTWTRGGQPRATIGFHGPRSHKVVDVASCPQLEPALDHALAAVRRLAPALGVGGEIHLALGRNDAIHVVIEGPCERGAAQALVGQAGIVGVAIDFAGKRAVFGAPAIELDEAIAGSADSFAQASDAGNRALGQAVKAALGEGRDRALLELFAGAGNLTRHARALGWQVTASDVVAPPRPLDGIEFLVGRAQDAVASLGDRWFDTVLLDPPRTGAREVMDRIAAICERVIYVSCDPATLARDVQGLLDRMWMPIWAQPLDLMPDTAHVEVVMLLEGPVRRAPPTPRATARDDGHDPA
ncbi:MAG: TRAM domain-containing protein [Deltaproteobacteria bacterium]|nr:TRAM domain-containing protein [Deltaproteobacteria bacterium]